MIEATQSGRKAWRSDRELMEERATPGELALADALRKRLAALGHHDIAQRRALLLDLTLNVFAAYRVQIEQGGAEDKWGVRQAINKDDIAEAVRRLTMVARSTREVVLKQPPEHHAKLFAGLLLACDEVTAALQSTRAHVGESVKPRTGDLELYQALSQKLARVHPSNQAPDLPMMIKLTYGQIARLRTAMSSLFAAPPLQSPATGESSVVGVDTWEGKPADGPAEQRLRNQREPSK